MSRQTSWNIRRSRRYCLGCGAENLTKEHKCSNTQLALDPPQVVAPEELTYGSITEALSDTAVRYYNPKVDPELL